MAYYKNPECLSRLSWIKVFYISYRDRWLIQVTHRNIIIEDTLIDYEACSLSIVTKFIFGLKEEINYYLNEIWC